MTEEYAPAYTTTPLASGSYDPPETDTVLMPTTPVLGSSADASSADVAKDQASNVAQSTAEAGQHIAGVAKDQVASVASEAGSQAKDLLAQARTELATQAAQQQQRVADGLRLLSDELHSMTRHDGQAGVATDLAQQGAQRSRDVASWLDQREPGHLMEEVAAFARRKPGMFLLMAAGAGLAAGRLTRGVKDASSEDVASPPAGVASPQYAEATPSTPSAVVMADDVAGVRPNASSQDAPAGLRTSDELA